MKGLFSKIAEQFKNHLINYEKYRTEISNTLYNLDDAQQTLRKEVTDGLEEQQSQIYSFVKEQKLATESSFESKLQLLSDKLTKVEAQQNSDVKVIKEVLGQVR